MRVEKLLIVIPLLILSCNEQSSTERSISQAAKPLIQASTSENTSGYNVNRNAYFGDLHVHTMYSYDAFIFGGTSSPDEAYRFAKGGSITHAAGFDMQLEVPMDFYAVTDHAYYMGIMREMALGNSDLAQHEIAQGIDEVGSDPMLRRSIFARFRDFANSENSREIMDESVVKDAWEDIVASANRHNNPGTFTTFIAYEYTGTGPESEMLHRNVIFKDTTVPDMPFSRLVSDDPEELWAWMDSNRAEGIESLAIPHNSNMSEGLMFQLADFNGRPLDAAYADRRLRNEPLVEITQVKGTSDSHPYLSPNDEWADFELLRFRLGTTVPMQPQGSYVREALKNGISMQVEHGYNPFKPGIIGSSDNHNASYVGNEDDFWGVSGLLDSDGQKRGAVPLDTSEAGGGGYFDRYSRFGASGLAGVWAEENTRESIYEALRRKETFGSTGPRMSVRFFAGYDLPNLDEENMIAKAYSEGVPMGSDLITDSNRDPSFIAWASKDPNSAPLQRLQIIKGWVSDGRSEEKVFDVACSGGALVDISTHRCPNNGASVNLSNCNISADKGSAELKAYWRDPEYDASQHAFYYVRAIENPSCRWSTWDAIRAGVAPRADIPPTLEERVWSSPIWLIPS
ncbi:MAG: DUF3604 domain-containing protein [Pseudomonadota bacterium]|nr:DUF3604 domain-containing protein [Pseudomonadota bacterium]